jgi:hypothetical protein
MINSIIKSASHAKSADIQFRGLLMLQQSPEDAKNCQLFQRPYAMSFMPQAKVFISLNHLGIFFASNEKRGIFLIKVHVTTNVFFCIILFGHHLLPSRRSIDSC